MSLQTRITDLVNAIGADIKALLANQGNLTTLTTTAKSSLVAAINELQSEIGSAGAQINDTSGNGDTTVTWSADKIYDELQALKSAILGGASSAYDTLLELQNELTDNDTAIANLLTAVGNRVRFDAAQTLTTGEKTQARDNIGAADAATLSTLSTNIGDTDHNFVTDYTAAKA